MSREERQPGSAPSVFDDMYPYRGRFESYTTLPPTGRDRAEILHELRQIARSEDARWETGRISGSYYHGGKEHYAFLNEIFGLFLGSGHLEAQALERSTMLFGQLTEGVLVARLRTLQKRYCRY